MSAHRSSARLGWYSGDPHIHPEGQPYEMVSSFGLTPETMIRQVRGEGLNFGSILIWSNGYYYQKQFLTGTAYQPSDTLPFPEVQHSNNTSLEPRPTPHDEDSVFDDIGAPECLVDATHGVVDFLSGCRNQAEVELNFWYHLLNCGFSIPLIAETDFVFWSARAGAGRTYVRLDGAPTGNAGYEAWAEGIRAGRVYAGDGRSHFIDFRANGQLVGRAPLELGRTANHGRLAHGSDMRARRWTARPRLAAQRPTVSRLRRRGVENVRDANSRPARSAGSRGGGRHE